MSRIRAGLAIVAMSSFLVTGAAIAQVPNPLSPTPPASDKAAAKKKAADDRKMKQQKTASCQKQAKDQKLKGPARSAFMTTCTSSPI
jgi:hypothetical protein